MNRFISLLMFFALLIYTVNTLLRYIHQCRAKALAYSLQPGEWHRRMSAAYAARADWWWLSLPDPETMP